LRLAEFLSLPESIAPHKKSTDVEEVECGFELTWFDGTSTEGHFRRLRTFSMVVSLYRNPGCRDPIGCIILVIVTLVEHIHLYLRYLMFDVPIFAFTAEARMV
jgi:hypothetical protein